MNINFRTICLGPKLWWKHEWVCIHQKSLLSLFSGSEVAKRCADFEWNDNECNDAGDCWRGQCICDTSFSGYKCQLERKLYLFCSASLPLACTGWVRSTIELLRTCPHSKQCAQSINSATSEIKIQELRVKPGMAGCEARTLPLCYVVFPK